jgi:hypothetical protein
MKTLINSYKTRLPQFAVLLGAGCASMGPGTIGRDRVDYDHAVTESLQRQLLEILIDVSASIDVPPLHIQEGRTTATRTFDSDAAGGFRPLIRIHSGSQRPEHPFVATRYRGNWFWVDDLDYPSKVMFSFLLILSSLNDVDVGKGSPIITIPAN